MSRKIIGLTGFAKSGKSTTAEIFKDFGAKEMSFAGPLKDACSLILDIPRNSLDDQNLKEVPFSEPKILNTRKVDDFLKFYNINPDDNLKNSMYDICHNVKITSLRHAAQFIGTNLLRSINPDIHVTTAFNKMPENGTILFSDIRFKNEAEALRKNGGVVIGVNRAEVLPDLSKVHESERYIPDLIQSADYVFNNDSDLNDFKKTVLNWIWSNLLVSRAP